MAEPLMPALIGDPDPIRFSWLKDLLDAEYGLDAVHAEIFDKAHQLVIESNEFRKQAGTNKWSLIFISDDLPYTYTREPSADTVKRCFTTLDDLDAHLDFVRVLIISKNFSIDYRSVIPPRAAIRLPLVPPTPKERQVILGILDGLGGLERVPSAESKLFWDQDDRILREQIRTLSAGRNLQDGESHLARLISRCVDCSKVEKVEIKRLGQGRSGASVFRLSVETIPSGASEVEKKEFVLKLCQAGAVWKLESEVRGHMQANQKLGHPGYRAHLPVLNSAYKPRGELGLLENLQQPNRPIVRSGDWYAIHFDFLGGKRFGKFIDLETALVTSAKDLGKKMVSTEFIFDAANADEVRATRLRILDAILQWLCENWYANPGSGYVHRKESIVWDTGDAPEREYVVMPPYQLTARSKGWIQSFLDSPEANMGARFFSDWEKYASKVWRLVSEDGPPSGQLNKPLPVVLSHVHGDLNASNILLWLRYKHPFLIDFPFYQEAGHALQDFARLEVEIKLGLLDRQKDSPEEQLKAFEHTYSQMPIWQEMENCLLDKWDQNASSWQSLGYEENVQLCYQLVQLIRRKAREVQQNIQDAGPPAGDFLDEYWPALLYHTVRAIGYTSLSVFKRLLAVYSAGSILTKLNCYQDLD